MDVEKEVLRSGEDIHLVDRVIIVSKDIGHAADKFFGKLNRDESERFWGCD